MSETNKNDDLWKLSQNVPLLKEQMEDWQERNIQIYRADGGAGWNSELVRLYFVSNGAEA